MHYRVNDLPARGLGAFTPFLTTSPAASSQGLLRVVGAPGTHPVDAPDPCALPSLTAQGGVNSAQGSKVSPDVIYPCVYVAAADNLGPENDLGVGMWRRRFCELPMPAINPGRVPVPAFQPAKVGGRRALAWPRAFQRFPNRAG